MASLTGSQRRRIGSASYSTPGMNKVSKDVVLGDRVRYLDTDGSFAGTASGTITGAVTGTVTGADVATQIWVSPNGVNTSPGTIVSPVLTLAAAFALVTATRKHIFLMPGTYSSGAALAWPVGITGMTLQGIAADPEATVIHATAGAEVITILPDATIGADDVACTISNVTISSVDSVDGVSIANTNMATGKTLAVGLHNCAFAQATVTDKSILTTHTAADADITLEIIGRGWASNVISGLVYIDIDSTSDVLQASGMYFSGGVEFSTDTKAALSVFDHCLMKDGGGAGGQDTQVLIATGCVSITGTTYAVAALADFAANAAETILSLA